MNKKGRSAPQRAKKKFLLILYLMSFSESFSFEILSSKFHFDFKMSFHERNGEVRSSIVGNERLGRGRSLQASVELC